MWHLTSGLLIRPFDSKSILKSFFCWFKIQNVNVLWSWPIVFPLSRRFSFPKETNIGPTRTSAGNEEAVAEPPAKRAKLEHWSHEDVSKIPDPCLGHNPKNCQTTCDIWCINCFIICFCNFVDGGFPFSWQRKTVAVNNSCDIIIGENGAQVFLQSRGKNQFFDKRELSLGKNRAIGTCPINCDWSVRKSNLQP